MELDDLRGRETQWRYASGFPLSIQLIGTSSGEGRLWKPTNNKPDFLANFAGIDWRLLDGMAKKWVGFRSSDVWLGYAESWFLGMGDEPVPRRALIDEARAYQFRRVSPECTDVLDGGGALCVSFHHDRGNAGVREGRVKVSADANVADAPPLVLLGIIYAIDGGLFIPHAQPW